MPPTARASSRDAVFVAAVLRHLPCLLVIAGQLNIHAREAYVSCWGL